MSKSLLCLGGGVKPAMPMMMRMTTRSSSHPLICSPPPLSFPENIRMNVSCRSGGVYLEKKLSYKDALHFPASPVWEAEFDHDGYLSFCGRFIEIDESKYFTLPPFVTLPHCQTQIVTGVVMSSCSHQDKDCVVAVKFLGPQISFYRPCLTVNPAGWINCRIDSPCFFNSSNLIYSKKDDKFRMVGSGGHGSWDRDTYKHKSQRLRLRNLPVLSKKQREVFESCWTREFLIESETTDETFLVKWHKKYGVVKGTTETQGVDVFKLDGKGNAFYTQDIGDLVINLSEFCKFTCKLPDESYPEKPNHVVIFDHIGFFSIDLATGLVKDWF